MSSQIAMAYDTVKPIDHTEFDPKWPVYSHPA
jgi:hypothetical protein